MSELEGINEHLSELRKRILRIALVVGVITVFVLTFHITSTQIDGITLYYPIPQPLNNIAAQVTDSMRMQLVPEQVQLIQTAPGQAFFAQVYVAALIGLGVGMPVIIKEMVGFLKPALKEREINVSRSIVFPALGLFAGGCLFAYFLVVPFMLEFLYRYGESAGLLTFLNIMDFITFVLQFQLAFGLSFQLPIIMYAATASGAVDTKFWRKNIRYAIVIIVIFGAVITPDGSGVTMWFIGAPMIGLYVSGMLFVEHKELEARTLKSKSGGK